MNMNMNKYTHKQERVDRYLPVLTWIRGSPFGPYHKYAGHKNKHLKPVVRLTRHSHKTSLSSASWKNIFPMRA